MVKFNITDMKTFLYISLVGFLTFSFCSCSEWLDVQPKTEVKQDKMFESESGFKDALIGCYMPDGREFSCTSGLTYTFLEVLAQYMILSIHSTLTNKLNYILIPPLLSKQRSIQSGARPTG